MNTIADLQVGDFVTFEEERQKYEVRARGKRYLVCTKPANLWRTVLYTVVDLEKMIRGPENLIFGAGAETREQCEEMIDRLEGAGVEGCPNWHTEVSYRNNVPVRVKRLWFSK